MSNNGTKDLYINPTISSLKIIGGRDITNNVQFPDLFVKGGARIRKSLDLKNRLNVGDSATIKNDLTVLNGASITGGLTVQDGASITGGLNVQNSATIGGGATINGATKITGKLTVTGVIDPPALVLDISDVSPIDGNNGNYVLANNQAGIWLANGTPPRLMYEDHDGHQAQIVMAFTNANIASSIDNLDNIFLNADEMTIDGNLTVKDISGSGNISTFTVNQGNVILNSNVSIQNYTSNTTDFSISSNFDLTNGEYTVPYTDAYQVNITINYKTDTITSNISPNINPYFVLQRISPTLDNLIIGEFPILDFNIPSTLNLRSILPNGQIVLSDVLFLEKDDVLRLEYQSDGLSIPIQITDDKEIVWSMFRILKF
jgi:hypothetical protein